MRFPLKAYVLALANMAPTSALAAEAGNSSLVYSSNSTCAFAVSGGYQASTFSFTAGKYYLARYIPINEGIYAPIIEYWSFTPNSANSGGSYSVVTPNVPLSGYPINGSYTGNVVFAFASYSFNLTLSCGANLTGLFYFGQ